MLIVIIITKAQVAALLSVDERTVTRYQNREYDPLPIYKRAKRGHANEYCAIQIHQWAMRQQLKELKVDEDGQLLDYEKERARLTHHQANKTELEAKVLAGELIPADVVEEVQGNMVGSFRSKMLSIPTKSAGKVQNLTELAEIEDCLREDVHEALTELSEYDPSSYGISVIQEDSGDSRPTSETDG